MVRSFQDIHVSKKDLTKTHNMARKISLRSPSWQENMLPRVGIPGQPIHGPSMDHRIPIDGAPTFLPWPIDGTMPSQFLPGYKKHPRDFYEKRLEINNIHDSISSRECSECKKCIRNRTNYLIPRRKGSITKTLN